RSTDRGATWAIISPDLTRGTPGPSSDFGHTLTTIAESPLRPGLLYVGTDDGRVHITPDGGRQWIELTVNVPGLPADGWVTRLECSPFAEGVVYLAVDRHRRDDRMPYLFRSDDSGRTWVALAGALPPDGPVHVVRADPVNRQLLYAGTEYGLFLSLDGGVRWEREPHLPTVPVHDLVVHPRDGELVIGTHGRGIYVLDIRPLQQATGKVLDGPGYLFEIPTAQAYRVRQRRSLGSKAFAGQNPPYGAGIYIYLREPPAQAPVVAIREDAGRKLVEVQGERRAGLQRLLWPLNQPGTETGDYRPVATGNYTATLVAGEVLGQRRFRVEAEE